MDRRIIFLNEESSNLFNKISRKKRETFGLNGTNFLSIVYFLNDPSLKELIAREVIFEDVDGNLFLTTEPHRMNSEAITLFKEGIQEVKYTETMQEAPVDDSPTTCSIKRIKSNIALPPVINNSEFFIYTMTYTSFVAEETKVLPFLKDVVAQGKHVLLELNGLPNLEQMQYQGVYKNRYNSIYSTCSTHLFHSTDFGAMYIDSIKPTSTFLFIRQEGLNDLDWNKVISEALAYDPAEKINKIRIESITNAIKSSEELVDSLRISQKEYLESLTKNYKEVASISAHIESMRHSLSQSSATVEYYKSLIINKEISDVHYDNGKLIVTTKILSAYSSKTERLHVIGQFLITIAPTTVSYKNLFGTVAGHSAPHIQGHACYGNISDDVAKLTAEKNYEELLPVLLAFLKSAKTSDGWGSKIKYFPLHPFQEDINREDHYKRGNLGRISDITVEGMFGVPGFEERLVKLLRMQDNIPDDVEPIKIWS